MWSTNQRLSFATLGLFAVLCLPGDRAAHRGVDPSDYKLPNPYSRDLKLNSRSASRADEQLSDFLGEERKHITHLLDKLPQDLKLALPDELEVILSRFVEAELAGDLQDQFVSSCAQALFDREIGVGCRLIIADTLLAYPSQEKKILSFFEATPDELEAPDELSRINLAAQLIDRRVIEPAEIARFVPSMNRALDDIRSDPAEASSVFDQTFIRDIGTLDQPQLQEVIAGYLNGLDFTALDKNQKGLCSQLIGTTYGGQGLYPYNELVKPFVSRAVDYQLSNKDFQLSGAYVLGDDLLPKLLGYARDHFPFTDDYHTESFFGHSASALFAVGAEQGGRFIEYICTDLKTGIIAPSSLRRFSQRFRQTVYETLYENIEQLTPALQVLLDSASKDPVCVNDAPYIFASLQASKGGIATLKQFLRSKEEAEVDTGIYGLVDSQTGMSALIAELVKGVPLELAEKCLLVLETRANRDRLVMTARQKKVLGKYLERSDIKVEVSALREYLGIMQASSGDPDLSDSKILALYNKPEKYQKESALLMAIDVKSPVLLKRCADEVRNMASSDEIPHTVIPYLLYVGGREYLPLARLLMEKTGGIQSPSLMAYQIPEPFLAHFRGELQAFLRSSLDRERTEAAIVLNDAGIGSKGEANQALREHVLYAEDIKSKAFLALLKNGDPAPFERLLEDGFLSGFGGDAVAAELNSLYQKPNGRRHLLAVLSKLEYQSSKEKKDLVRRYRIALSEANAVGIRLPFRLRPEQLVMVVQNNKKLMSAKPVSSTRPVTGIVLAEEDWNGAFLSVGSELRTVFKRSDVYYRDATSDEQAFAFLKQAGTRTGGLNLTIIGGHGRRGMLSFNDRDPRLNAVDSSSATFDTGDQELVHNFLKPVMTQGGICMLLSCSVGEGKSETRKEKTEQVSGFKPNLVEATAQGLSGTGVTVYGSIMPLSVGQAKFRYGNSGIQEVRPKTLFYTVTAQR